MRRELLERYAELRRELQRLHAGRTVAGDVDLAERERQLSDALQAIQREVAEEQFRGQQERDTRTNEERMTELAFSFPALSDGVPGVSPWDQDRLNEWAQTGAPGHGAKCAAEFLLYVWNPGDDTPWAGRFSLEEALKTWDVFNRFAFQRWAENPFWP